MLEVFVGPQREWIKTADNSPMRVYKTEAHHEGEILPLQDVRGGVTSLRIILRRRIWPDVQLLDRWTTWKCIDFLNWHGGERDPKFDCYSFVNLIKGVLPHQVEYAKNFWMTRTCDGRPVIGSAVFLLKGRDQFRHAAIHLGRDVYLSVYGAGGDLEVASLYDMRRDFGADKVIEASPLGRYG